MNNTDFQNTYKIRC